MIHDSDLLPYLQRSGVEHRVHGKRVQLRSCPYCESGEIGDWTHFSFDSETSQFRCVKCDAAGNLLRYMRDRGDLDDVIKARPVRHKRPAENVAFVSESSRFFAWYEKERCICSDVLKKYDVGHTRIGETPFIVYQYRNEAGELINRKYRSVDKTKMWTEKDAEQIYYGMQHIDFASDVLHVVEGEDDCHALAQIGITNVVSVPFGAKTYSPEMDKVNSRFKTLVLLFDNDSAGQQGARKFAEKAGLTKCKNVFLPFKDARECLINGYDIFKILAEINKAEHFRDEEVVKADDVRTEYFSFIRDQNKMIGVKTPIGELNKLLGGIRRSEVSVVQGHTGSGKSTFAYNMAHWSEMAGMRVLIMSFENRLPVVLNKFVAITTGQCITKYWPEHGCWMLAQSPEWIELKYDDLSLRNIYFLNKNKSDHGYYDPKRVIEVIEYAHKFYDVDFIVIDHLHYFLKLTSVENPVAKIDETIRDICHAAQRLDVHIMLLVHPSKTQDKNGEPVRLGINSSKGSSSIQQECDNFFVVSKWHDESEKSNRAMISLEKNRMFGRTGQFELEVLENGNSFVEVGAIERSVEVFCDDARNS